MSTRLTDVLPALRQCFTDGEVLTAREIYERLLEIAPVITEKYSLKRFGLFCAFELSYRVIEPMHSDEPHSILRYRLIKTPKVV